MIVTFHGFLGAPSLWADTFAAPALAGVAVEHRWLPGHGPSPWWPASDDFDAIVDGVLATLPDGAFVVGYSLGARLALGLLARGAQRLAGAVLIGAHPGLADEGERGERRAWDDAQADAIEREGLLAFAERWSELPIFATQAALPDDVRARQQAARRDHRAADVARAMRALGLGRMPDYGAAVAGLARVPPVTLLAGALDEKFARLAAATVGRWPGARAGLIAGAGHNVPLEAPGALAVAVREALAAASNRADAAARAVP